MKLDEAKQILNENGYELLDEGKLSRAIGIGALALSSLFSHVNARDLIDFKHADIETVKDWCEVHPVKCDFEGDHILFNHSSNDYKNPDENWSITYIPLKNNTKLNKIRGKEIADVYMMNVPNHQMLSLHVTLYDYTELVYKKHMDEYTFEVRDAKTDKIIKTEPLSEEMFYQGVNSYYDIIIE